MAATAGVRLDTGVAVRDRLPGGGSGAKEALVEAVDMGVVLTGDVLADIEL